MLLAEDARAQTDAELTPLRQGLTSRDVPSADPGGACDRPARAPGSDPARSRVRLPTTVADVRIEAANAVAQLARGAKGVADAKTRLLARAKVEGEPRVWAAVAAALGRLPYTTAEDIDQVEPVIARVLPTSAATAIQIDELLGATQGLESLARQSGKISKLKPATLDGLRAASTLRGPRRRCRQARAHPALSRRMALTAAARCSSRSSTPGLPIQDDEVRRLTMIAARAEVEGREAVIRQRARRCECRSVRYEALADVGPRAPEHLVRAGDCRGARQQSPRLAAGHRSARQRLPGTAAADRHAAGAGRDDRAGPGPWHAPAHAIVALAKTSPAEARKLLPRYVTHPVWQVRMYAAHAAGPLAALDVLEPLGRDAQRQRARSGARRTGHAQAAGGDPARASTR